MLFISQKEKNKNKKVIKCIIYKTFLKDKKKKILRINNYDPQGNAIAGAKITSFKQTDIINISKCKQDS